uniref:Uncharacterized protein n=1 Tax=Arundo donax TaxID=35708 RepID=A0A0A9C715_ARUDO
MQARQEPSSPVGLGQQAHWALFPWMPIEGP